MHISRFVSIIVIIALIFCSTSCIFASNVNVTNQGNSWVLDRETVTSAGNTDIGGLLSRINEYVVRITQRLGPVSDDGGINTQLYNMRTMLYSIMQNVINYLGPVTTPSGSKALNELTYMIWSATTALGPSIDGTYTNSSLILAQEQAANTTLSSILTQDTSQTSHLANIRQSVSLMRDNINNIDFVNFNPTVDYSLDNENYSSIFPTFSTNDRYLYLKINSNIQDLSLVKITLPVYMAYTNIDDSPILVSFDTLGQTISYIDYLVIPGRTQISIIFSPFTANVYTGYPTRIKINFPLRVINFNADPSFSYLSYNSSDYYLLSDYMLNKDRNLLLDSYTSKFDHLTNLDTDLDEIITILDKSTSIVQNDNEVNVQTNISIDDVNFVNTGIRRFKQFFDTGITAAAFGLALDSYAYDEFFDQEVTDLVQTVNNQYTEVPLVINTWPII